MCVSSQVQSPLYPTPSSSRSTASSESPPHSRQRTEQTAIPPCDLNGGSDPAAAAAAADRGADASPSPPPTAQAPEVPEEVLAYERASGELQGDNTSSFRATTLLAAPAGGAVPCLALLLDAAFATLRVADGTAISELAPCLALLRAMVGAESTLLRANSEEEAREYERAKGVEMVRPRRARRVQFCR